MPSKIPIYGFNDIHKQTTVILIWYFKISKAFVFKQPVSSADAILLFLGNKMVFIYKGPYEDLLRTVHVGSYQIELVGQNMSCNSLFL